MNSRRHERSPAFSEGVRWEKVQTLAQSFPQFFNAEVQALQNDFDIRPLLHEYCKAILSGGLDTFSLPSGKYQFTNDSDWESGYIQGNTIHLPRLEYYDFVYWEKNRKKSADTDSILWMDLYQQNPSFMRLLQLFRYQMRVLFIAIHELYHARQSEFSPKYAEETDRANRAASDNLDQGKYDATYTSDLGERSAYAIAYRGLIEFIRALMNAPQPQGEAWNKVGEKLILMVQEEYKSIIAKVFTSRKYDPGAFEA